MLLFISKMDHDSLPSLVSALRGDVQSSRSELRELFGELRDELRELRDELRDERLRRERRDELRDEQLRRELRDERLRHVPAPPVINFDVESATSAGMCS